MNKTLFLCLQGPRTQIDAFQKDIFSWLNDIPIKTKYFLESWDREIWYKTFNLDIFICSWSQSLNIWKIQWFFCLNFAAIITKTNFLASTLQPFSKFWKKQNIPGMKAPILSLNEPEVQGRGTIMEEATPISLKVLDTFSLWGGLGHLRMMK